MSKSVFLDIYAGDAELHASQTKEYHSLSGFLAANRNTYGIPPEKELQDLDETERDTISEAYQARHPGAPIRFNLPSPLSIARLEFDLNASAGLSKTTQNFVNLVQGFTNKRGKLLHYEGCAVHRIVKDFVAQTGDVTRGDGSGGESIYGGKFNDEKEGLQAKFSKGCLAMANSGKNSNTSQFFVCLTDDPTKLKKLDGKYVVFGKLKEGLELLSQISERGSASDDGKTSERVWIGACGVL
ncbi:hypothetical protein BT69DRAFT_1281289, partial [Atractiella rhizophila]